MHDALFDCTNFGQLFRREFCPERFDSFLEGFCIAAARYRLICRFLSKREGLLLITGCRCRLLLVPMRGLGDIKQRVGKIAPSIELLGTNADLCLSFGKKGS